MILDNSPPSPTSVIFCEHLSVGRPVSILHSHQTSTRGSSHMPDANYKKFKVVYHNLFCTFSNSTGRFDIRNLNHISKCEGFKIFKDENKTKSATPR